MAHFQQPLFPLLYNKPFRTICHQTVCFPVLPLKTVVFHCHHTEEILPFQWMSLPLVSDRTCLVSFNAFEEQHHCNDLPTWKSRIQQPLYFSFYFWLLKDMLQSRRPTGTQDGLLLLPSCWGFPFLGCFPVHPLKEEEGALHGPGSTVRAIAFILRSSLLHAGSLQRGCPQKALLSLDCCSTANPRAPQSLGEEHVTGYAKYTSSCSQKGPVCSVIIGQCQYYVDFPAGQSLPELKGLCTYQACSVV